MNKLKAYKLWLYRKILKISRTTRTTIEDILRRIGTHNEKRKVPPHANDYPEKDWAKTDPSRRLISWLENVQRCSGLESIFLIRAALDRERFIIVIANHTCGVFTDLFDTVKDLQWKNGYNDTVRICKNYQLSKVYTPSWGSNEIQTTSESWLTQTQNFKS